VRPVRMYGIFLCLYTDEIHVWACDGEREEG
jgi:hypothetical protein